MECVTIVQYSIRFNNVQLDSFRPTRGLHQGDPFSPYIFLFVADGLSKLMQQEVQNGNLNELYVCWRALGISHLLFADDTLIFMEANENQAETVKSIIKTYEKNTDQLVNPAKCSMVFGSLCPDAQQQNVREILQVTNLVGEERYLGLPTRGVRVRENLNQQRKDW
jgi:hypothetical protein